MKLVHPNLAGAILQDYQNMQEWIIEAPMYFAKYVQELHLQIEGEEGLYVLSEDDKELELSKYAEMIINPFSVQINDKKILNKLYGELSKLACSETLFIKTQEIVGSLQNYFVQLEQESDYILAIDEEINIISVLKALGVRLESIGDNFFESLNQYIKVQAELMQKKLIVLVNIQSFLSDEQIQQLIETATYNELTLLLIENYQNNFSTGISRYIIDKDGCEIF